MGDPNGAGKEKDDGAAQGCFGDTEWSRPTDGALGLGFEGEWMPDSAVSIASVLAQSPPNILQTHGYYVTRLT